ncbi:MAG: zinc-ribbon domain-containing protein [Candidatus Bathyarchaeota archaeon]|nr:zinc-ribbon domain-containing protein [Candidatus Bathyarchaeota archaeon]
MPYCRRCGTMLEEGAYFCHKCGTPVVFYTPPPVAVSKEWKMDPFFIAIIAIAAIIISTIIIITFVLVPILGVNPNWPFPSNDGNFNHLNYHSVAMWLTLRI